MTGSLVSKNGKYFVIVRLPDDTGKQRQRWINTGVPTDGNNKRLAKQKMNEILNDLEKQKPTDNNDISFVDSIWNWMSQKKNEIRLNSYEAYEWYISKHIEPYFKPLGLTVQTISRQHIEGYYKQKLKEGLSASSIQKHNVIIRGALEEAMRQDRIQFNPTDRAKLPARERFVGKAYSVEQASKLLEVFDNEPIKAAVVLGLFYGLRRSEALGLRWRDIDFNKDTISICNTVVKTKTRIEHEQTKSKASKRTLFIIPETRDYLISLKQQQQRTKELLGASYPDEDHVCVWPDGRPFLTEYISQRFAKVLKNNNMPHIRFHELRHTAGSILLENGVSVKHIQEYLGHERAATTLDIYGHLSIEGKRETANRIGQALSINRSSQSVRQNVRQR